jgi:hypothetical protein
MFAAAGAFAYIPKRKIKTELMPVVRRIIERIKEVPSGTLW